HLEVLAAVLVLVRRTDHTEHVLLRRQRHGAGHPGAGTGHRVDDLLRRGVDDLVVVGLEPDTDLLSRHALALPLRSSSLAAPGFGGSMPPFSVSRGRACRSAWSAQDPHTSRVRWLDRHHSTVGGAAGPDNMDPGSAPASASDVSSRPQMPPRPCRGNLSIQTYDRHR